VSRPHFQGEIGFSRTIHRNGDGGELIELMSGSGWAWM